MNEASSLCLCGLLKLHGSLAFCGLLPCVGSLLTYGFLLNTGSLLLFGLLNKHGSLMCRGLLSFFGSLFVHGLLLYIGLRLFVIRFSIFKPVLNCLLNNAALRSVNFSSMFIKAFLNGFFYCIGVSFFHINTIYTFYA